ncbi:MAG TPA: oligosaccharide flippase family protein [Levilinea sp.]|nr:oligosaccharide flippase family protein [Levilinea sp.]
MKFLSARWQTWKSDRLMGRVIRNTSYLFSSNMAAMALGVVQSIFAARLLGVAGFGLLGTVTVFASTINRLFSFRMGELVVKYLGADLAEGRRDRGGALVKVAALVEASSSLLAFMVMLVLAPLAAVYLAKDAATTHFFWIYGISILSNSLAEVASGVLQVDNRFRGQALVNLAQSVLTALIIVGAFLSNAGMMAVLIAYLVGKLILGIGPVVLALGSLRRLLGPAWWKAPFSLLPPWRELTHFGLNTNLSATVNLLVRDSEILWVALFLSPVYAGYYKVALAIINLVLMPVTPLISTTFPEINHAVALRKWQQLRHLLRRVTILSGSWTLLITTGLVFFGNYLILFYGREYLPAFPALLVLLVGYGIANIFFWNRTLLLSLGLPDVPFRVTLWVGIAKVALGFVLVPRFGYVAEAALLSAYFIVSVGLILRRGALSLHQAERALVMEGAA